MMRDKSTQTIQPLQKAHIPTEAPIEAEDVEAEDGKPAADIAAIRGALLSWYDVNKRALPWRALPGIAPDPYHVWLSEIMLQQTTVPAVIPYFEKFLHIWPTIAHLAAADQADILKEWAGLGYYARARNLHKCAQIIVADHGGRFPADYKGLKSLPGIGDYTAAAIMTIAFQRPATVMDGNIERVAARLHNMQAPLPAAKKQLKALAALYFSDFEERPGDLAQGFMDFANAVCLPKNPKCMLCPVRGYCAGHKAGHAADLPVKARKTHKPRKHGRVYWIETAAGDVLTERRPEKGMLAGMPGLPCSPWVAIDHALDKEVEVGVEVELDGIAPLSYYDGGASSGVDAGFILHSFTHFDLKLYITIIRAGEIRAVDDFIAPDQSIHKDQRAPARYFWTARRDLMGLGFPTLFNKVLKMVL